MSGNTIVGTVAAACLGLVYLCQIGAGGVPLLGYREPAAPRPPALSGPDPTVELPGGRKLVTVVWRVGSLSSSPDNLWFLTRDMREGDLVETYELSGGGSEKVTIRETLPPRPW